MLHHTVARVIMICCVLHAPLAIASSLFDDDKPRIYTIEPHKNFFDNELQLGVGLLPSDYFYHGLAVAGSYTYHFSSNWGWEVVNGFYAKNFDTSLRSDLRKLSVVSNFSDSNRLNFHVGSNLLWQPIQGKMALLNQHVLLTDIFATVGLGVIGNEAGSSFSSINAGLGMHVWITPKAAIRLDARDLIILSNASNTRNNLLFMLSYTVHFTVKTVTPLQD